MISQEELRRALLANNKERALLLGNGFSIQFVNEILKLNGEDYFKYDSLTDKVIEEIKEDNLKAILREFASSNSNLEEIIRKFNPLFWLETLDDIAYLDNYLNYIETEFGNKVKFEPIKHTFWEIFENLEKYHRKFKEIQLKIIKSIVKVFIDIHREISEKIRTLEPSAQKKINNIKETLCRFKYIFTTNYDLILYWIYNYQENYDTYCHRDLFSEKILEKDSYKLLGFLPLSNNRGFLGFLHGAIHILVLNWFTVKVSKGINRDLSLIEVITEFYEKILNNEERGLPLIILEGDSQSKIEAINRNE